MKRSGRKHNRIELEPKTIEAVLAKVASSDDGTLFYISGRNKGLEMGERAWFGTTQLSRSTVKLVLDIHARHGQFHADVDGKVRLNVDVWKLERAQEALARIHWSVPEASVRILAEILVQGACAPYFAMGTIRQGSPMYPYVADELLTSELADLMDIPLRVVNERLVPKAERKVRLRGTDSKGTEIYNCGMHGITQKFRKNFVVEQLARVWPIIEAMQQADAKGKSHSIWEKLSDEPLTRERIAEDAYLLADKKKNLDPNQHVQNGPQYRLLNGIWTLVVPHWEEDHLMQEDACGRLIEHR